MLFSAPGATEQDLSKFKELSFSMRRVIIVPPQTLAGWLGEWLAHQSRRAFWLTAAFSFPFSLRAFYSRNRDVNVWEPRPFWVSVSLNVSPIINMKTDYRVYSRLSLNLSGTIGSTWRTSLVHRLPKRHRWHIRTAHCSGMSYCPLDLYRVIPVSGCFHMWEKYSAIGPCSSNKIRKRRPERTETWQ